MTDGDTHIKSIWGVDEYLPAPGQFTNTLPVCGDDDTAESMAAKLTEAYRKDATTMVSLGAFGGYITFHFDHSIINLPGADILINGNAFSGSSEPGIVMVSKDVNGNGIADDPWYELRGSCDTASVKPTYNYEITYTFDPLKDVAWKDNQGNTGSVKRNAFHRQEYYPLWLHRAGIDSYTLKGTRLPNNAVNQGTNGSQHWVLSNYDWGYVDNLAKTDKAANSFDISNAVDSDRKAVDLDYIDFVRVYTALNQEAGWLGETSTEVCGAEDLHLDASIHAIYGKQNADNIATFEDFVDPMTGDALTDNSYYMGQSEINFFTSGKKYIFNNSYNAAWMSWSGYGVSTKTATTYDSSTLTSDQFNVSGGKGYKGSKTFGVVYASTYGATAGNLENIESSDGDNATFTAKGMYVNNTAYVLSSLEKGDIFAGDPFTQNDWLKFTAYGFHKDGTKDSLDFYLADYTSEDATQHYIIKDWTYVDLSPLGEVTNINFWPSGSRTGAYGLNTPSYFAMDNFGDVYDGTSPKAKTTADRPDVVTRVSNITTRTVSYPAGIYTPDGRRLSAPQRGLNIIKMADGTVRKIIMK